MKRLVGFTLCLLASVQVYGQQDPQFTRFFDSGMIWSPAEIGKNALSACLIGRHQWVGLSGNPVTYAAGVNGRFTKDRIAAGALFVYDKLGFEQNHQFVVQGAYRFHLKGKHFLNVGVAPGIYRKTFRQTAIGYPSTESQSAFSLNAGITWRFGEDGAYVGISGTKLFGQRLDQINMDIQRKYYLYAGYVINVGGSWRVHSDIIGNSDLASSQLAAMVRLSYRKKINAGVGYRPGDAILFTAGGEWKGFSLGYAYDLGISKLRSFHSNAHELILGWKLTTKQ
jgi:type IX secretion system PorP/SprF family membrane protein